MADPLDDVGSGLTRREWLKHAGIAGAAAAVAPIGLLSPDGAISRSPQGDPLENLTGPEAATLDAIVARLIPTDEHGPGAREARAARYIDRALGGALASSRDAYRSGLAAWMRTRTRTKGAPVRRAVRARSGRRALRDMESQHRHGVHAEPRLPSSPCFARTRGRARSAIRTTAVTPTSSGGISSAIPACGSRSAPTISSSTPR